MRTKVFSGIKSARLEQHYSSCLDNCDYFDCPLVSPIVVMLVSPNFTSFYVRLVIITVLFKKKSLFYLTASLLAQAVFCR